MPNILLLIVEDEVDLANMYATKLKLEGFDVDIAHDGLEGLQIMKTKKPAIVLMDVLMPNLNGLQALQKAKQDPEIQKIPVIVLTNLSGTADYQNAIKAGAIDYIVKSQLNPDEVVQRIKAVLTSSVVSPAVASSTPKEGNYTL